MTICFVKSAPSCVATILKEDRFMLRIQKCNNCLSIIFFITCYCRIMLHPKRRLFLGNVVIFALLLEIYCWHSMANIILLQKEKHIKYIKIQKFIYNKCIFIL